MLISINIILAWVNVLVERFHIVLCVVVILCHEILVIVASASILQGGTILIMQGNFSMLNSQHT